MMNEDRILRSSIDLTFLHGDLEVEICDQNSRITEGNFPVTTANLLSVTCKIVHLKEQYCNIRHCC